MTETKKDITSYIQTIIFSNNTDKQWNAGSAKKWMFERNLCPIKKVKKELVKGKNTFRYCINPPEAFKKFLTKPLPNGITYIIGFIDE